MTRHELALKKLHEGTVIPANPLALDENRNFDVKRQRAICRYYLDSGVGGLAVAVHTTQFEIRDPQYNLLEPVLKVAKEEVDRYEKNTGKVIIEELTKREIEPLHTPGIVCASHGPFTWGKSPAQAVYHAVVLEEVAKMAVYTRQIKIGRAHV